ncbi:hypothetical protein HMPREF0044_0868 [Gleimia coleocanis DSM 15436]|uniref:Uncharacterized protein n=1 Tax=Gleimia coleocanis DSM 15436 TaxID=525245 RepID=C0VZZ0_9ACTO|nr:hypothetical protein [Gleimia coleocanis]EEH63849.1 hypothetical protein HMPREF0044_0868 [Gleimia coleocanis DSM 15436]
MQIPNPVQSELQQLTAGKTHNLLDADRLIQHLEVWATLMFEEFWDGYGMNGGVIYQNAENHPTKPLLKNLAQRGIGLNSSQFNTNQLLATDCFNYAPLMLDYDGDHTLKALITNPFNPQNTLLNFLTFDDFYSLLAEHQEEDLFATKRLPAPNGKQIWNICLTDYTDSPDWTQLKRILTFAETSDGTAHFKLYDDGTNSFTLVLKVWGKLIDPTEKLKPAVFRDLLKLAKLGLNQLDFAIFYDYGFTAVSNEHWQVTTTEVDYTVQIRELAGWLRKFMGNKDTQQAGVKLPKLLVVNPPLADGKILQGSDLSTGHFWVDEPTYFLLEGKLAAEPFLVGE